MQIILAILLIITLANIIDSIKRVNQSILDISKNDKSFDDFVKSMVSKGVSEKVARFMVVVLFYLFLFQFGYVIYKLFL